MKKWMIFFLLIYSYHSVASVTGILKIDAKSKKAGDVIKGTIAFHPVPEESRSSFYSLKDMRIGEGFVLLYIDSLVPNKNNVDVLELSGYFVITKPVDLSGIQTVMLNQEIIPIQISNVPIEKTEVKSDKLTIVEQDYDSLPYTPLEKTIILLLLLIATYFIGIYFIRRREKINNEKELARAFEEWNNLFEAASKREDFEHIFVNRENWIKFINVQTPPIVEFNRLMHLHQYKKEWTEIDRQEVEMSFENIKEIFK